MTKPMSKDRIAVIKRLWPLAKEPAAQELIVECLDEIERLRAELDAIDAALPHTKDGVRVLPGMTLYTPLAYGGDPYSDVVASLDPTSTTPETSIWSEGCIDAEECYSTEAAARAAGEKK